MLWDPSFIGVLKALKAKTIFGFACLIASGALLNHGFKQLSAHSSSSASNFFPATAWPEGKPNFTTSYSFNYDLQDKKGSFERVCDFLLSESLGELGPGYEMPKQERDWMHRMLEYNVKGGKMNRGLMVVEAGVELLESQGKTADNSDLIRFAVQGWCIEFMQTFLLMADDIMDDSKTRRGQPCWYRVEGVKMIAVNDFMIVESIVFKMLKRHFGTEPDLLANLYDLYHEALFQTECGQLIDIGCDKLDLNECTEERWKKQVTYKTAFYSFYLSVAAAMLQVGIRNKASFDAARDILVKMGVYFQAQDDYLDAFGTHEQLGKIGTDIQDRKCSWLFVQAYHKLGNAKTKAVLEQHYGKCKVQTPEEEKVKQVYRDLKLPEAFAKYEQNAYDEIMALKGTVKDVPWSIFEIFLKKIFKREK